MFEKAPSKIKQELSDWLSQITVSTTDKTITVLTPENEQITLSLNYDFKEVGFKPGDLVLKKCEECASRCSIFSLCVGFGKGCYKHPDVEELWFIFAIEGNISIGHYCNFRAVDFKKHEIALVSEPKDWN